MKKLLLINTILYSISIALFFYLFINQLIFDFKLEIDYVLNTVSGFFRIFGSILLVVLYKRMKILKTCKIFNLDEKREKGLSVNADFKSTIYSSYVSTFLSSENKSHEIDYNSGDSSGRIFLI